METSLVVQRLRIHPPVWGTGVQSLVLELRYHMPWGNQAHELQLLKPVSSSACALQQEKSPQ